MAIGFLNTGFYACRKRIPGKIKQCNTKEFFEVVSVSKMTF